MSKTVLVVMSENGLWVEELVKPVNRLKAAGYSVQFATPSGKTPFPDGASLDPTYKDPPLGRAVTSQEFMDEIKASPEWKEILSDSPDWNKVVPDRLSIKEWLPVRPYLSSNNYIGELEKYYTDRKKAWEKIADYDALLLVGGSGPVVDMVNNNRIHDLILGFYYADKPIAAECYTVTCLAFARELDDRNRSLLNGKHCTGHTMEYDYTDGWSIFANGDYLNFGAPPFSLEYILRDAVGYDGQFHGNVGRVTSVIVDYPFITSRSVASSDLCGQKLVEVLTQDLRKWGWK